MPEYISAPLTTKADHEGTYMEFIQLGKPTQNANVERFNRTFRHERLELVNYKSVDQEYYLATQ